MPHADSLPPASLSDAQDLSRLADIAAALRESSTAEEIRRLVSRINEGRFFVACVGQFKRGKSTLLDALVGEDILPTGVVPVTTVPTVLRYGAQRVARVLIDGNWRTIRPEELGQYVSEELNPQNKKRVEGVEVFLTTPLLASGMCLVDTPGIGSVFSNNTAATNDFIPQIDAAILVVGADPPISGEELALIEAVSANVDHIVVVLNKMDRVSPLERQQAGEFAARMLATRLKQRIPQIYEVSALGELQHAGNEGDWEKLKEDLQRIANTSGRDMTRSAAERGTRRFSAFLGRSVDERVRALQEPIENSEQRIAGLRQTVGQAEQSLRDLGTLFSAEQMRLSNVLLARRKTFLREVSPSVLEELQRQASLVKTSFGPALRRELMSIAQTVARQHVVPWFDTEEAHAAELYTSVTARFVSLVNELLQRISQEQSADFAGLPKSLDAEEGFRTRSRFYFHEMITLAQPASPLLYCADVVMGTVHNRRWFRKAAESFLAKLLDTNASRVQGDVEQRVVESRLGLESEVRKLLREVSATAERALSNAKQIMAEGTSAVSQELERLRNLHDELERMAATK